MALSGQPEGGQDTSCPLLGRSREPAESPLLSLSHFVLRQCAAGLAVTLPEPL